jgi:hypothetical protein
MLIMAHHQGVRIIEIPVNYRRRLGRSKITGSLVGTLKTGLCMLWLIVLYRFLRPKVPAWSTKTPAQPQVDGRCAGPFVADGGERPERTPWTSEGEKHGGSEVCGASEWSGSSDP